MIDASRVRNLFHVRRARRTTPYSPKLDWLFGGRRGKMVAFLLEAAMGLLVGCRRTDKPAEPPPAPASASPVAAAPSGDFAALMHKGHADLANWRLETAINSFTQALKIDPSSYAARANLGVALLLHERADDAVEALRPLSTGERGVQVDYLFGLALLKSGKAADAVPFLRRAAEAVPADASVQFQLGIALQDSGAVEESADAYRRVLTLDRFHITASYRLARLERQAGRTSEADKLLLRSEQNRALLGADAAERESRGFNRFTRPVDPPLKWQPPAESVTSVLADRTKDWHLDDLPSGTIIAPIDINKDGAAEPLALSSMGDDGPIVREFSGGQFRAVGRVTTSTPLPSKGRALIADYDNDGLDDVLIAGGGPLALLRQTASREFASVAEKVGLPDLADDAAWIDIDHDGDVDIVCLVGGRPMLLRNQGNGSFVDDTRLLNLPEIEPHDGSYQIAVGELNDDDSIDLAFATPGGLIIAFNAGAGEFNASRLPPRRIGGVCRVVRADDVNNDGALEAALLHLDGDRWSIGFSDPAIRPIEPGDFACDDFQLTDLDADGFLDVVAVGPDGVRGWRNAGAAGWRDWGVLLAGSNAASGPGDGSRASDSGAAQWHVVAADWDHDGRVDLGVHGEGLAPMLLRSEATNPNHRLAIVPTGTKSNRAAIGARIDIRAGESRIFRNIVGGPIVIGVGQSDRLDLVKLLWTTGAADAFTAVSVERPLEVVETTITLGSCPYLYVWDGATFRFVTDILGNSPLGLSFGHRKYLPADTNEIVYLGDESSVGIVTSGNGRKFVRCEITDELREILYLDLATLLVADRPAGVELHSTDRLMPPPFPPSEIRALTSIRSPNIARRSDGADVTQALAASDRQMVGPVALADPHLRGLAAPWWIELDFGAPAHDRPLALLLDGWLQYGDASVNIAASQNPAMGNPFPRLSARTSDGVWHPIDVVVGAPAGKTKTILIELDGLLPPGADRLRLDLAAEIHWDRIALGEITAAPVVHTIPPDRAELRFRGVSRLGRTRDDLPRVPDYHDVLAELPWRHIPSGYYTRYGDVRELLTEVDDRYVVFSCGDAARIDFDVTNLPPPPDGHVREYFLLTDGWDKDMDHNVFTGDTVEPLPLHGQDDQQYGLDAPRLRDEPWIDPYNIRWVPADRFENAERDKEPANPAPRSE